ncbi:MAG: TonB-dependent receptor [Prevotellaceae bacterium]|nr:TonB-dependent receptor [Prevotellaceae bacterium]
MTKRRLFLFYLCGLAFAVFAAWPTCAGAQPANITISVSNENLRAVFDKIEKETVYRFTYLDVVLPTETNITLSFRDAPIETVVARLLASTPLTWKRTGNTFAIIPKPPIATNTIIRGRVLDEAGQPLVGAGVFVKNTRTGAATDIDGRFSINATTDALLEVSFIGFLTRTVNPEGRTEIEIVLTPDTQMLEEVVVVGYGVQKKVNLTGAVDQITSEVFEKRPITNISQGLVGAVPNLNIKLLDGKPTQSPDYNIRGATSIGQSGNALILIDGVEGNPAMLNPNDVESISVLKDAASSSIYGARAAFGVILITTKSPVKGKTSVTYTGSVTAKSPTTIPDNITDSYPWAQSFNTAWSNWYDNGTTPTAINKTIAFSPEYLNEIKRHYEDPSLPKVEVNPTTGEYRYYYSTDWYKELYKNYFFAQDHNIAISGGNDIATFYVSGRYNGEDGLYRYNTDHYTMYNLRSKGTVQITKWLQLENNTEYSMMSYHQPLNVGEGRGIWRNIADEGHPLAPLLNPDGSLSFSAAYTVGDQYYEKNNTDIRMREVRNKTELKAEFLDKSLTVRADFTFRNRDSYQDRVQVQVPYSRYYDVVQYIGTNTNDFYAYRSVTDYLATNVYADYTKTFNNAHTFKFLAGFNYEQSEYGRITATRNGLVTDDARNINLATGENITTAGRYEKWEIAGGFFRMNYHFKERYLLEVNGRYDGSSKFPESQQWGFFPSASVGWRVSEEPFWKMNHRIISNLKVRASYGSLGNGAITSYSFAEKFSITQSGRILNDIRPQKTSQPNVIPASLTWETATNGNIGLDVVAFNNRLQFTGDIYRRWTKDMYTVGPSVPAVFGADVPKGNYADMETQGWELSIKWEDQFPLAGKIFGYNLRFILSDYTSVITRYYNPDKNLSDYYEGQRIGEIWGYQVEGLFRSDEEIANSPYQGNIRSTASRVNHVGDLKFKNLDDDKVIYQGLNRVGDSGDKTIIGNSEPRYIYGINIGADWYGVFFNTFFQGVMKQDWYPSSESRFWGQYNRPYNAYPRWQQSNQFREELGNFEAYLPRLVGYQAQSSGAALTVPNDRYLQNVAYIRLRSLNIGYTLPKQLVTKIGVNDIKIYLSGENIWTWSPLYNLTSDTDVTGIYGSDRDLSDGSAGDGYNYPMLKSFSLGLTVHF